MIALLTALVLLVQNDAGPEPDRLANGRYAVLGTDGSPLCGDNSVDHFDLYALNESPHARSRNLGNFRFLIDGRGGSYILHSPPVLSATDPDGVRQTRMGGGRVHTVGRAVQGVLDSQTIGEFSGTLTVDTAGHVRIVSMSYDPQRWGGERTDYVVESQPAGPFGLCGG